MRLAKMIMFVVWIGGIYRGIWDPILEKWNNAQGLGGKIFVLESYLPLIAVPAVSYIKAFAQKEKRDFRANFIISGIVLFFILAIAFSIHHYGLFNLRNGLEYFAINWFGMYLFIGALTLACVVVVKLIEFTGA